ncbi:MAG: T9SS type A sorting domain-containing protein [Fimbriimonadaceae bacterium]|nr:T9SS type A sorting domain-containing protein [Chitinophagales bacterium]
MKRSLLLLFITSCILNSIQAQVLSDTIDFSEYESETIITDQYLEESFLFSGYGGSGNPVLCDYGVASWGKVLRSDDWFNPIKLAFVDSTGSGAYRVIEKLIFDNPINPEVDYISVDAYDSLDVLQYHYMSTSPEHIELDFTTTPIAYVVFDDSASTAYIIDNIVVKFKKGNDPDTTVIDTTQTDTTIIDTTIIDTTALIFTSLEKEFIIFPNPSNGDVNITAGIQLDAIEVRNEAAQIIYALKPQEKDIYFHIDVPGIYFVTVKKGTYSVTKKIVITH